jgi:translation initiation factor 4G
MRQASGTQGPLAPGNQQAGGHNRRESSQSAQNDLNNQSGAGQGRGGFPQGGRGRGGFQPQYQPQTGYPPQNSQQFRGSQNQGRGGGMAPPFPAQGRPQFPNSPHQVARSPALTPSMPGTPNMNPAMPMQNQPFTPFFPQQHMQPPQVHHSSFSNNPSDISSKSGNRGKGKKNQWSRNNEQSSNRNRSREHSRELFGHSYASNEQMHSERESYDQNEKRNNSVPAERSVNGHFMPPQHYLPPLEATLEHRISFVDQAALPPLPPPPSIITAQEVSQMDLSPCSGDFNRFLTSKQASYGYPPQQYDPRMSMQNAPYMFPQMQGMGYMSGPPASPQPNYQQPNYIPGQYAPQGQPMSRNSSQMSEQRPASSMGQPQTPSMTASVSHPHTPQPKANPTPSPVFTRTTRKSAAIVIKRPDGEAIDVESFKAPASPAPSARARTPPVIASTPTPPPKPATPQHARTDSAAIGGKTQEQIRLEIQEKVKKAAEADKAVADQAKAEEDAKAAEAKLKEEQKAKEEARLAEEAKAKEEADAKAAAAKAKQEEEEELERQIREMEEAEAEREKKEAELLAKRAVEKAAADKAKAEKEKADAAENDRKLREAEREMERLEDEREKKRAEAEAKAAGKSEEPTEVKKDKPENKDEEKNAPNTPSTLASKLSNLTLGTDSGASTPASDDSMGPPPSKVNQTEKRGKPAALNLAPLNTKPVEPPQPSAALQSLKSARFLTVLNPAIYPTHISSPNPALNSAVMTKGKSFKYDKEFLLQFQKVFTEKPSMEFASQIKALIGDGDGGSARSGSSRTPGGMGPGSSRSNSARPIGASAMGAFVSLGKTLPAGTTSDQRYAMSMGAVPRPPMAQLGSFNRPGGAGFPGGSTMARSSSNSNMSSMPSPRQQSRSQRSGSKRDNFQSNPKAEAQAAKTMPLTAGMELKPIQVSATGWKPRSIGQSQSATGAAGPTPGASGAPGHMDPDLVQRKVKAALNKMTPEKFDKIADQILAIAAQSKDEADGRTLRQVIQLTFEKATDEAHWASMYARFCKRMLETMSPEIKDESILDKNGNIVSGGNLFRKYLLNRCQEEFERGWKMDLPDKPEGEPGDDKTPEAVMLSDEYYIAAAAKRRGLGLVQFIGELYKLSMLTERIMHECVKKLVDYTGIPDEAEIESLTKLLKTIGGNLDSTEKGKPMMDVYFTRIQSMIDTPELPSRLRFMLMDIVDLRKKRWQSKEDNKGPKTLEEVRAEVCILRMKERFRVINANMFLG